MGDSVRTLTAVIPAAGEGRRLGLGPKAFVELAGQPLLYWLTRKMLSLTDHVTVAVRECDLERARTVCPECSCIAGGASRQDTIERMVDTCASGIVLIQDVARPFASLELLRAVIQAVQRGNAAAAFWQPEVPVAVIQGDYVVREYDAGNAGVFQAPQAFGAEELRAVLARAKRNAWHAQSTAQLYLRAGGSIRAIPGEKYNIKLTTPEDWQVAQALKGLL